MDEPVLGGIVIPPARAQEDVPPLRVVGAVGEELGLQADRLPGPVGHAALAADRAVQGMAV